jgi:hypothetical protein
VAHVVKLSACCSVRGCVLVRASFALVARIALCVVSVLCRMCPRVICTLSCCSRVVAFPSRVLPHVWFACRACCSHACPLVVRTVVLFRASYARYVARVVHKLAYCFVHRKLTSLRISRANYISYLFDSC